MKAAGTYDVVLDEIVDLVEIGRRRAARMVNATMTAVYWSIGRRIVVEEQRGARRAEYGEELVKQLAQRLTVRFGRGFGTTNLKQMRTFYLAYAKIGQTLSDESVHAGSGERGLDAEPLRYQIGQTVSDQSPSDDGNPVLHTAAGASDLSSVSAKLPLPWSHYVKLLSVKNDLARRFYEAEALRGGWTVRQLDRQIQSQFYERTLLSRNKRAMLDGGQVYRPEDEVRPEDEIKDPFLLEFLGRTRSCSPTTSSRLARRSRAADTAHCSTRC